MFTRPAILPLYLRHLLLFILVASGIGAEAPKARLVPDGATFRVEFDKPEYILGEHILAHAILSNEGTEAFRASFGGDYRGSGRANRFKITVTDSDGSILPDPLARRIQMNAGGFLSLPELKPGDQWFNSLPLCQFVHFPKEGRYRVKITHDFGGSNSERTRPVAEAELVVRMPTAEEAQTLVAKAASEKFSGGTVGKRTPEHANYASLYHPVFLPYLRGPAEKGDVRAVETIADIETPEATGALIDLMASPFAVVSNSAIKSLRARLPFVRPLNTPSLPGMTDATIEAARAFQDRCWKPELSGPLAKQARLWLKFGTPDQQGQAITFLGFVGDNGDVPSILDRINEALSHPSSFDSEDLVSYPPRPCGAAVAALRQLDPKPEQLKGNEGLYYLIASGEPGKADLQQLHRALDSARPALEKLALKSLPIPLPEEFRPLVLKALRSTDSGVADAAADVAAKDKHPSYRPAVVTLLATERNLWALRSATSAALVLNARYEAARAWAAQLDNPKHWFSALSELATITTGSSSGSGTTIAEREQIVALRQRWEKFLAKHERDIRKGLIFEPGNPTLPENLFAPLWQLTLKDSTSWPAKK